MKDSSIVIYGVGDYGKRLYQFLKEIGIKIDCFCQTISEIDMQYDNVKIIDIEQLSKIEGNLIILIAIYKKLTSKKIKGQLLNLNRSDIRIYEMGEFINNNIDSIKNEPCYCNICGKNVKGFEQATWALSEIFEKYHVIGGGGIRDNTFCPFCRSTERHRWQYWVLGKHTNIFRENCAVLHIAPEKGISERIQENELCDYYFGSIVKSIRDKYIVDVTDIQFKDNYFDYIIMNHVLEHVRDEAKAIEELKRVIKKDGKIVLSFPICTDFDTYENPDVLTPEDRLKEYGQMDHVRLYGRDYKHILEKYDLNVKIYSPQKECSSEIIRRYGFSYDDVILICTLKNDEVFK